MLSLGLIKHYRNGDKLDLSFRYLKLNEDKLRPSPVVNGSTETLLQLNGSYQRAFGNLVVKLGAQIESSEVNEQASTWSASAHTRLTYQF